MRGQSSRGSARVPWDVTLMVAANGVTFSVSSDVTPVKLVILTSIAPGKSYELSS